MVECHWLFDKTWFPGSRDAKRKVTMARGRCCDVDGIDLGIVNEIVGAIVRTRHVMAACVVARLLAVTSHHRDECGSFSLLKSWTALDFSDVAASDDPPANHYASSFGTTLP